MRPLHSCRSRPARAFSIPALLALLATACGTDPVGPPSPPPGTEVGVVLSSRDRLLTVFAVDSPAAAFGLGLGPDGSPVTLAVRGTIAAVPLGTLPAVAVADLAARRLVSTVPLPEGSGATGVAFLNDSIAIVANAGRNTVSPVNVKRGTAGAEIPVGTYPQAVLATRDTVFVLNANLGPDFSPAGPGSVSVIAGDVPRVVATIRLGGTNPSAGAVAPDGRLYVVDSGSFGAGDGSLSIIDRRSLAETRNVGGFGDFPGALAFGADGRAYVASFSYGLAIWDPATDAFVRAPSDAVEPAGIASASGVGVDAEGRLYALKPSCREASAALRLTPAFDVEREIPVGICPFAIAFTRLP